MANLKYIRVKHMVYTVDGEKVFCGTTMGVPSISKAKKESARLQESNGGLGMGSLQVRKGTPVAVIQEV